MRIKKLMFTYALPEGVWIEYEPAGDAERGDRVWISWNLFEREGISEEDFFRAKRSVSYWVEFGGSNV